MPSPTELERNVLAPTVGELQAELDRVSSLGERQPCVDLLGIPAGWAYLLGEACACHQEHPDLADAEGTQDALESIRWVLARKLRSVAPVLARAIEAGTRPDLCPLPSSN